MSYVHNVSTVEAITSHGVFSSLSSFITATIRLISLSVCVGGTMRENIAPTWDRNQHTTELEEQVSLLRYTNLRSEAPTQHRSCPGRYRDLSDLHQCGHQLCEK